VAASLLLAACGSDPPASDGGISQPPGGTGGSGSSTIPAGCTNDVQTSSLPEFTQGDASGTRVQSLGPHTVGDTVDFEIPQGTVSFTIVEQAVNAPLSISGTMNGSAFTFPNWAVPLEVLDPGNHVFFNDNTSPDDLTAEKLVFLSSSPGIGTLTAPNTSAGLELVAGSGFPAGTWSLQVSDWAYECAIFDSSSSINCSASGKRDSEYDVSVITKAADGHVIPSAGTIDLAIYFATSSVGGIALSEETAASDHDLNRMVSTLKGIYAAAGITITGPTYNDLPQSVQDAYATGVNVDLEGACSPLAQLLKNALSGNTLNIFLVSRLTSSDGNVVGIDGTIPGPASIGGTVASGAAVSVEDLRSGSGNDTFCPTGAPRFLNAQDNGCGADNVAYAIAHEAGHFMGPYHTTESSGLAFDPLQDTDPCPCSRCANLQGEVCSQTAVNAHQMDGSECSSPAARCGGADNLMFWSLGREAAGVLKEEQKQVMLTNPLVHQ